MRSAAALLALLLPSAAAASQLESGGAPGQDTRVILEARDCRQLVTRHRPSIDTAYKAGVDVRGNPVVPADLASSPRLQLPEVIVIDILIPLEAFLGERTPPRLGRSEVRVGEVRVEGERLSFNGQPLGDPAAAAIAAACRRILEAKP